MKKILSLLLAIVLVSSVLLNFPVPSSAESLYIRKIVSVVYDDSGSMGNKSKASYASYAMQTFCGMLNSEDQLYITYMRDSTQSGFTPQKMDLSAGGIQSSVDSIRDHVIKGGTPYSAVEKAYQKLASVQDSNPNTQYWLVVITDGEFDEGYNQATLNSKFQQYANSTMPNGTKPQVTFLGIGNVTKPTADENKGIYTYEASTPEGIIDEMSKMADRISGRTRLQGKAIEQVDDRTIRVSSSIPLLNIAVLAQGSDAKLSRAAYDAGSSIPISRKVSMYQPGFSALQGGAYLVGDSQTVIDAATYTLTFDKPVNLDNVVVLFEPALEVRMSLTLNGKEIKSTSELNEAMEGDKISVTCKIFEMGTDKEVSPSLMPGGTKFQITVSEEGKVVHTAAGKEMEMKDYTLKNLQTEITGAVLIDGFNPIDFSVNFTPTKYVPRVVYSIVPSFGSDVKSVKFTQIANNTDLSIVFTVLADGVPMTDPNAVKALHPEITTSSEGDKGKVEYTTDGKIIFTPNEAVDRSSSAGSYNVTVTCTLENGVSASEDYTVLLAAYEIVPANGANPVKRHEMFGNETTVSFYITKDGVKLDKAAVEKGIDILLSDAHANLKYTYEVAPDGTITVLPYSDEEHILNFGSWWGNWSYYWGLPGEDLTVTLRHAFGTGSATIDIVEADGSYLLWNVWAPLILEILILAAIIAYIVRYVTKPRFAPNAVLYIGRLRHNSRDNTHTVEAMTGHQLKPYNTFKNLWNPFKELTVKVGSIEVTAAKNRRLILNKVIVRYSKNISPKNFMEKVETPEEVAAYTQKNRAGLIIQEIMPEHEDSTKRDKAIRLESTTYHVVGGELVPVRNGNMHRNVIDNAKIICYTTRKK